MKKKNILAAVLALVLVACAGVGSAHAYFTTFAEAQGGYVLDLGYQTEIREDFYEWTKHVTIRSSDDSVPVFVRARAYGPDAYDLVYSGDGWTLNEDDGWYYYDTALNGGETSNPLLVKIEGVPENELLQNGEKFNVVVVYEATPALYDENGNAYADWGSEIKTNTWEGGGI